MLVLTSVFGLALALALALILVLVKIRLSSFVSTDLKLLLRQELEDLLDEDEVCMFDHFSPNHIHHQPISCHSHHHHHHHNHHLHV